MIQGEFDYGLANFWFSHIPRNRIESFLQSFHERLGSGTQVFIADNVYVPGRGGELITPTDSEDTYKRRELADGSKHEILKNYFSYEELNEDLSTAVAAFAHLRGGQLLVRELYNQIIPQEVQLMSVTFHTTVMKAKNKNATGISIPEEVMVALAGGKKPSVSVTLNGYTYQTTIAVMGGEYLIPLSEAHRQASGLRADDPVEVTLALETAPRTVEVPADLQSALSEAEGAAQRFEALAYSKRKEFVRQVEDAKTQETRLRRITNVVTQMSSI